MDEPKFKIGDKVRDNEPRPVGVVEEVHSGGVISIRWPRGHVTLGDPELYDKVNDG
jgi:hypothetical protein